MNLLKIIQLMLEWWYKYNNWLLLPSMILVLISRYFYTYFSDEAREIILVVALVIGMIKVGVYVLEFIQERKNPNQGEEDSQ